MPTYEYECIACRHKFDVFQRITEKLLKRCPKCDGKVRRLIGKGAGIIFKGSGFHQTDYRSENYKKQMKEEKSVVESTGKKKEEKTKAASSSTADAPTTSSKAEKVSTKEGK